MALPASAGTVVQPATQVHGRIILDAVTPPNFHSSQCAKNPKDDGKPCKLVVEAHVVNGRGETIKVGEAEKFTLHYKLFTKNSDSYRLVPLNVGDGRLVEELENYRLNEPLQQGLRQYVDANNKVIQDYCDKIENKALASCNIGSDHTELISSILNFIYSEKSPEDDPDGMNDRLGAFVFQLANTKDALGVYKKVLSEMTYSNPSANDRSLSLKTIYFSLVKLFTYIEGLVKPPNSGRETEQLITEIKNHFISLFIEHLKYVYTGKPSFDELVSKMQSTEHAVQLAIQQYCSRNDKDLSTFLKNEFPYKNIDAFGSMNLKETMLIAGGVSSWPFVSSTPETPQTRRLEEVTNFLTDTPYQILATSLSEHFTANYRKIQAKVAEAKNEDGTSLIPKNYTAGGERRWLIEEQGGLKKVLSAITECIDPRNPITGSVIHIDPRELRGTLKNILHSRDEQRVALGVLAYLFGSPPGTNSIQVKAYWKGKDDALAKLQDLSFSLGDDGTGILKEVYKTYYSAINKSFIIQRYVPPSLAAGLGVPAGIIAGLGLRQAVQAGGFTLFPERDFNYSLALGLPVFAAGLVVGVERVAIKLELIRRKKIMDEAKEEMEAARIAMSQSFREKDLPDIKNDTKKSADADTRYKAARVEFANKAEAYEGKGGVKEKFTEYQAWIDHNQITIDMWSAIGGAGLAFAVELLISGVRPPRPHNYFDDKGANVPAGCGIGPNGCTTAPLTFFGQGSPLMRLPEPRIFSIQFPF